jgi:glycosyltransferase involved in cell wall biosynthesis
MTRRTLVLNHFAVTRGAAGGTRHIELFSRLDNWSSCILAADHAFQGRQAVRVHEQSFQTVPTTPFSGNYATRVLNWASYACTAFAVGLLRKPRPDVVYGSSPHLLAALTAWALARLRRARFVLEIRDIWPLILVEMNLMSASSLVYRSLEGLERFLYRRADRIVILAEGTGTRLAECGVPASRITHIPNGAEPSDFVPSEDRYQARARLGLDGFVFVYAGAHGEANGLELLLKAAGEIRQELPEVSFLLLGDGPSKQELVDTTRRLGLKNVLFRDPVPKDSLANIFVACDAGIHVLADVPLFRYGVSPNKVHDYMAAGLPVLTNTPGEVARLVEDASAGVAVDASDLAAGVRRIVKADDQQRDEWSASGRAFMEEHRSRTVLAAELKRMLEGLLSEAR